jgi:solute carrier family 13 (sodium-dependent dicarboxylate transporter), member 2/3/5
VRSLSKARALAIAAGFLAFAAIAFLDHPLHHLPQGSRAAYAAATTALMAIWWLTEAMPMHITACMPLLFFPILGVFNFPETLKPYFDPYIFLFFGGMCIGAAMQQWDLHRRIALTVMKTVGADPRRLLAGSLAATAFISLWISNTATAAMMMPIGLAVIRQLETRLGGRRLEHYGAAIMMSVAYAANVGGIGTKIGTAPNAIFSGFMETLGTPVSFLEFSMVGFPFVVMFLPLVWWSLWRVGKKDQLGEVMAAEAIDDELAKLGPTKRGEWIVLIVFILTAVVWMAGAPISAELKAHFPKIKSSHIEGGAATLAALVLFITPIGPRRALELPTLKIQPWSSLLLLGGSFAMAEGIQQSGLSAWIAAELEQIATLHPFVQVLIASTVTVALSAVASNVATTTVMLNVLKSAVTPSMQSTVLFSATISASCDFALPAGTPPNAIVFASGYISIPRMAKTGVVLDLLAAIISSAWCYLIVRTIL